MAREKRVLFICNGNSARSQMAEGVVNALFDGRWQARSAGVAPVGLVHPLAIDVMREIGVNIAGQRSKSVDEFRAMEFDVVVTLCDQAQESCPIWLAKGRKIHLGYPDPARVDGANEQRLQAFRDCRDALRHDLQLLLGQPSSHSEE
jgi:arsenate reductase (thioredoxin)